MTSRGLRTRDLIAGSCWSPVPRRSQLRGRQLQCQGAEKGGISCVLLTRKQLAHGPSKWHAPRAAPPAQLSTGQNGYRHCSRMQAATG